LLSGHRVPADLAERARTALLDHYKSRTAQEQQFVLSLLPETLCAELRESMLGPHLCRHPLFLQVKGYHGALFRSICSQAGRLFWNPQRVLALDDTQQLLSLAGPSPGQP